MDAFLLNATVTVSVVFMLAVGSTVPILLFRRRAFSLTRRRKPRNSLIAWRFSGIPSHVTMPPRGRAQIAIVAAAAVLTVLLYLRPTQNVRIGP